jgi:hypothetical protein
MTTSGNRGAAFNLGAASSPAFTLLPGKYRAVFIFTGAGSIALAQLGPDNSTFVTVVNAPTGANLSTFVELSGGTYQFVVTGTVSAAFASVAPAER